jgi:hypothetical protein
VMYQLTGEENFKSIAERWESYQKRILNRWRAFLQKLIFKALYY